MTDRLETIVDQVPNEGDKKSGGVWLEEKDVDYRVYRDKGQIHIVLDIES